MTDTIDTLLRLRAEQQPDKTAFVDPDVRINYHQLDSATTDLAAALVRLGAGKGTRVGLIMPNGVPWVRIALAATRIGAVLVPLSTLLTPAELTAQLKVASVQLLIAVEEFRGHRYLDDLPRRTNTDLPAFRQVCTTEQLAAGSADEAARSVVSAMGRAVSPSDPLLVMFTSGSSGMPKGVKHSHGSALAAVRSSLGPRCIDSDTRLYLPMPFFWVGGFGAGVLSVLLAGATLVTEPTPQPTTTLRLLERERVTLFRGWPDQAAAMARERDSIGVDLSTLRPGSLAALLPAEHRSPPGARANLFGMTESFGPYCGYRADTDMPESAWGSCGRPFEGVDIRIVDTETGAPLPEDAVGVIQVRGPHMLRGICRRSREEVFTPDGYYATGDLGRLDDEGFLFYHGRSDDMFKVNGASVYPSEVQQALRSIDGVHAAFVTNVPGMQSNRVGAAVVGSAAPDQLRTAARGLLSSFKVPTVWLILDDDDAIPRGGTGKVNTAALREMLVQTTGSQEQI
ncbi:acyl-CoA synthetase (AMP-forming)/AMP-acid ligase II [Mycobacterium sp. MAA66]|uniref:class I adenylate-forming enzyme family protein n=1 Tax=Mycobacterium sp. MAA66 TaxID=3156297 RepID=UPI003517A479